ncbi:MAG TPA: DinB family protein [Saprospiraceae bacterium]|nr:DinB family protein [Saprospiraceae bacterium]
MESCIFTTIMENKSNIAARLTEVFLSGKWVANTNYKELLECISYEQAVHKVKDLNSISLLVFHINYYLKGLNQVFEGGLLIISDQYSFDLTPLQSSSDWQALIEELLFNAKKFIQHVEKLSDSELDLPFIEPKYGSFRRNIEGVIEHSYYHLGQISLLKKLAITHCSTEDKS